MDKLFSEEEADRALAGLRNALLQRVQNRTRVTSQRNMMVTMSGVTDMISLQSTLLWHNSLDWTISQNVLMQQYLPNYGLFSVKSS